MSSSSTLSDHGRLRDSQMTFYDRCITGIARGAMERSIDFIQSMQDMGEDVAVTNQEQQEWFQDLQLFERVANDKLDFFGEA
ncbi:hypothetical protein N7533_000165 [Penicillium manginii]|uniref:uncharacterized protein n=1 Tax=Penicillium manginii TaxID=203109 RepID=UPI0025472EA2|nr:uncharacterized protein N7533_000165 [Penicillium manginii]KAJ5767582.1 hypothetical protein N7533_000165 [Penicillium manginii]